MPIKNNSNTQGMKKPTGVRANRAGGVRPVKKNKTRGDT